MQLPERFLERIKAQLGQETKLFLASFKQTPPTSIRVNPRKINPFDEHQISWSQYGYYLSQRPAFGKDPLFHAGAYYVQEASSMILEPFFKHVKSQLSNQPLKVLDLCAAPGGKSTHLLSLMDENDLLVTNEIVSKRNLVLQENIIKWGNSNVVVTQNKPDDFRAFSEFFDVILIDAPCSGEGMFRKDSIAIQEWSPAHVETCAIRQNHILESILPALKTGGYLIYSTCTYNEVENDSVVEILVKDKNMHSVIVPMDNWGQKNTKYGVQMYPHSVIGEGLYMACVHKKEYSNNKSIPSLKQQKKYYFQWKEKVESDLLSDFVEMENKSFLYNYNRNIVLVSNELKDDFKSLDDALHITYAGVLVGEKKGKNFVPAHELALSDLVNKKINKLNLSLEEAICYLKKEDFLQTKELENGYHLVTYLGQGLGWVKVLPNRVNNLYPINWRIK